jgi:glutamate formiminotransferase
VGLLDVAPVVYLDAERRGAACAEALVLADRLGHEAGLPVFLYGELAGGRSRAELRRGGCEGLAGRVLAGEVSPDFGPRRLSPQAGASLVGARPPLVAFNLELAPPADGDIAREVASRIREGGEAGLPGVRAIGIELPARGGVAQVSVNVEDHLAVPLAKVVEEVALRAPVAATELVGLAPLEAFRDFPAGLECRGRATLEDALGF